jgi:transcriptional regulator with XRE-family HTH domain
MLRPSRQEGFSVEEETFAERLRAHRMRRFMSQAELAKRAGLTAQTVMRLERGDVTHPLARTVRQLAEALGIAPTDLARAEDVLEGRGKLAA